VCTTVLLPLCKRKAAKWAGDLLTNSRCRNISSLHNPCWLAVSHVSSTETTTLQTLETPHRYVPGYSSPEYLHNSPKSTTTASLVVITSGDFVGVREEVNNGSLVKCSFSVL
jgi:hypothetical protein